MRKFYAIVLFCLAMPSATQLFAQDKAKKVTGPAPADSTNPSKEKVLGEVIVTGYGSQQKRQLTGSFSKINGSELENIPMASVDKMLQGKVAGVQSVSFNGQPGANQDVRIRGIGSYSAGSQPLIVIDGVQVNSGDLSYNGNITTPNTSYNVLAALNVNDIEDISILKDAAATAIYGSRGSNGVIIISTKKGKVGKTSFRFDTEIGQSKMIGIPNAGNPLRSEDFFNLMREGLVNLGATATQINQGLAAYGYNNGVDIDWIKQTTQTGLQQQYNLSMSGGDVKTQFFLSGGYFKQEGVNIGSDLQRISGSLKLSHNISSKLSVATNWNVANVFTHNPVSGSGFNSNPLYAALNLRPAQNPYNADGTYNVSGGTLGFTTPFNPLFIAENDRIWNKSTQILGSGNLEYKIIKGLKFTSHLGMQAYNMLEYAFLNGFHGDGASTKGYGQAITSKYFLYDWYNQLDYHIDILRDKQFTADVKLGYEAIKNSKFIQQSDAQNFPPSLDLPYSINAATPVVGIANETDYTFASLYSNLVLAWQNKYILSASFRRDGSSRFGLSNNYGSFPSVGFAWNVTDENFMQQVKPVSMLKLRTSYGIAGNANIDNYLWRPLYSFGYNYNGSPGGTFDVVGNTNLTWERSKQFDLGIDVGLLKNRINVTADYYVKTIDEMLFTRNISLTTGFAGVLGNVGEMENRGWELTVNATPIVYRDFSWDIGFNITHNQNKVLHLPGGDISYLNLYRLTEGRGMGEFYLKKSYGVDPANGNMLWYSGGDHESITNFAGAKAQFLNKSALPKYYGGFSNTFNYKSIYLSADFYFNYGNYVYDTYGRFFLDGNSPLRGKYARNLERWQKPGDITSVPKYIYSQPVAASDDRNLYKGDFIRLRNLVLGYKLNNKAVLDRFKLSSLHFYVRGTNLWTYIYDKTIPFDPELGVNGINNQGLLQARTITAGVNIGF